MEHATSAGTYRKVLGALLALTVITVLAAGVNFGAMNAVIALAIATLKATLVALFFMHLRHDKPMNAVIFVAGVGILAIFLMLTYLDQGERRPGIQPRRTPVAGGIAGVTSVGAGDAVAGVDRPQI
jgi:cytochrome c oxidase subunit 4